MSLLGGTVTVGYPGPDAGEGLAWELYQARKEAGPVPDRNHVPEDFPGTLTEWQTQMDPYNRKYLLSLAKNAVAEAGVFVTYLVRQTEVSVTIEIADVGLQSLPSPLTPLGPTGGPAKPMTLKGGVR